MTEQHRIPDENEEINPQHPPQANSEPLTGNNEPLTRNEEQTLALCVHIGGLLTTVIAPLVIWSIYKDRSSFIESQAKAALNWQILMLAGYLAGVILLVVYVGMFVQFAVFVLSAIFSILSVMAAYEHRPHRYPVNLPLVK